MTSLSSVLQCRVFLYELLTKGSIFRNTVAVILVPLVLESDLYRILHKDAVTLRNVVDTLSNVERLRMRMKVR